MRKVNLVISIFLVALLLVNCSSGGKSDGADGAAGTDGVSINWLGTLASAPATPNVNDAYYNSTDGISYIWDGEDWQLLTQDGVDGTNGSDGISINWLGSFDTIPSSPNINDAYFNNTSQISCIWNGTAWQTLIATSKSINCSIEVGDMITYTAGASFNMVYVPPKSFPTGTDDLGIDWVTNAYLIGETEVTYELWYEVYTWANSNSYTFENAGREGHDGIDGDPPVPTYEPVSRINWRETMVWTNALTEYYNVQNGTSLVPVYYSDAGYTARQKDASDVTCGASTVGTVAGDCDNPYLKPDANGFRLPTEAEWELAARYKGSDNSNGAIEYPASSGNWWTPGDYASGATADYTDATATGLVSVSSANSGSSTAIVKSKNANALGLYDMSGNVWEWNFDWYTSGSSRVRRGGSFYNTASYMQVGGVVSYYPYYEYYYVGFRLSRTP